MFISDLDLSFNDLPRGMETFINIHVFCYSHRRLLNIWGLEDNLWVTKSLTYLFSCFSITEIGKNNAMTDVLPFHEKNFFPPFRKPINSVYIIFSSTLCIYIGRFGLFSHSNYCQKNCGSIFLINSSRACIPDCKPEEGQPVTQSDH